MIPHDGVEVVGADRLVPADPPAFVAVVIRSQALVVVDLAAGGAGGGAVVAGRTTDPVVQARLANVRPGRVRSGQASSSPPAAASARCRSGPTRKSSPASCAAASPTAMPSVCAAHTVRRASLPRNRTIRLPPEPATLYDAPCSLLAHRFSCEEVISPTGAGFPVTPVGGGR